jgi:spore maturation protein CgeB
MKILYSWGHNAEYAGSIEREVTEWKGAGYDVTSFNHRAFAGISKFPKPDELDALYRQRHSGLMRLYRRVEELAEDHDVLLVNYDTLYHPDFLASLRGQMYRVLCSGDDPDASESCSKPYVSSFDHCFAWGVRFDEKSTVAEKFLEWGAKRADWWPHGVRPDACDPALTEDGIRRRPRRVDLLYIGSAWSKEDRLIRIRKHFGRRFKAHGNWGKLFPLKHGMWVRPVPMDQLVRPYRNAKIGINIHLTLGPCNMRLYELPANGVMQICDCADGLEQVFEMGREVIAYRSIEEAIEKIEYYLAHEDERIEIAVNGFRRVMKDYTRLKTFARTVTKVREGMRADGIYPKSESRVDAAVVS